jgi:hybrid cluster-associated redox disulfide protein
MTFSARMKVQEALDEHPSARWVFAAYHIKGCDGCSSADNETLEEVAAAYKIPLDRLVEDLNSLVKNDEG